jgi:membrane peptidoglycan carboxypeptidase
MKDRKNKRSISSTDVLLRGVVIAGLLATSCRQPADHQEFGAGLKTDEYWTIDLTIQELAYKHIANPLRKKVTSRQLPADTDCGFLMIDVPTGDVLAYIATIQDGVEYDNTINLIRSCGSVAKGPTYATALEFGVVSPQERILDAPRTFPCPECGGGTWQPHNYGDAYANAEIPLIEAFAWSKNIPAVDVYQRIRREDFVKILDGLGLPHPKNFRTAALGVEWTPYQLARAYSAFVNQGAAVEPRFISHKIVNGQEQETPRVNRPRVLRDDVCQWIIAAGRLCLQKGTGRGAADLSDVLAGKTGSSDSAIVVMFGPRVCAVLWVGNRVTNEDLGSTGGRLALPHLANFFRELLRVRPDLLPRWN